MSVAKIVDNHHQVLFTKDKAFIQDSKGNATAIAKRVNNLFYLQGESPQAYIADRYEPSQTKLWHERLGHLNTKDLNSMWKTQSITGLKLESGTNRINCEICAAGKLSRTPFAATSKKNVGILDIVHTDVCGPMRTESHGGARYFVTFIDDASRWCQVYFMRHKSEVTQKFKQFMAFAERQTGRKIKAVQSDNGKEY